MAQLTFTNEGDFYKSVITVNADFNLHIERVKPEYITIDVSTVENEKGQCAFAQKEGEVFDHDFQALVFPKYITIKSWSAPVTGKCYVTEAQ